LSSCDGHWSRAFVFSIFRVARLGGDAAFVVFVPHHPNVARFSPRAPPRVANNPVVLAAGRVVAVPDDCDAMVEVVDVVLARADVKDTAKVKLEPKARSVDADRDDRLFVRRRHERVFVARGDVRVGRKLVHRFGGVVLASTSRCALVGVVSFGHHAVGNSVLDTLVHLPTNAARVGASIHAIDELLLGKRVKRLCLEIECAFHGSHAAKK